MAGIGVDVGGTFTDVHIHKVPSTPDDQSEGVIRSIRELCEMAGTPLANVSMVVHGTTVATNITIEHNGAEAGMLTSRGFRDILHIGRHKRPHNFSLQFDVPWQSKPLVKRRNRIPITERILPPSGQVEIPMHEDEVRAACDVFKARGVESVIICFMFAFLNSRHEDRAREIAEEMLPGVFISTSSGVVDVIREFERFSTTAINAYVGPKTARYLRNLQQKLEDQGVDAEIRVMQSNGGIATVETCSVRPVTMLMSGPAGGVIGSKWAGAMSGESNLITVDIGGTSADISTIPDGRIKIVNPRDTYIGRHPVLVPMIDMSTIGTGGGSIAYIDRAGGFQVGPQSAGAVPGPVCYARGGNEPTVTDAHVVLGRLDPDQFLGGDLAIDPGLARLAIAEKLAQPLNMTTEQAVLGVIRIINSNMALAIRSNSVARGIDPREFALMPFGGAGPLHGIALAEEVAAKEVIVPPAPGINAAIGLLVTDMQYEFTRSVLAILNDAAQDDLDQLNRVADDLIRQCRAQLTADGIPAARQRFRKIAECRYQGQGFELRADMPDGPLTVDNKQIVMDNFHLQHQLDYSCAFDDGMVEVMTVRVIGVAEVEPLTWPELKPAYGEGVEAAYLYTRPTTFDDGLTRDTPRYDRPKLLAGHRLDGPAIVLQHNATTLIPPGYDARVSNHGTLHIRARSAA